VTKTKKITIDTICHENEGRYLQTVSGLTPFQTISCLRGVIFTPQSTTATVKSVAVLHILLEVTD
jgi:hypothetical protein